MIKEMSSWKPWIEVIRVKFFLAGIPSVILGVALSIYWTGYFNFLNFTLSLIGVILAMIGTYTFNEYYDFKTGVDIIIPSDHVTPFNAGSRILPSGTLKPEPVLKLGIVAWILYSFIAAYFTLTIGWLIIPLALMGFISGAFYTAPPFKWAYRGVGEAFIGLNYGPLITFGSYYVQAMNLPVQLIILPSLIPGLLITAVIWINEFPDYPADKTVGKMNLVARLGLEKARTIYYLLALSIYIVLLVGAFLHVIPLTGLIVFVTLPITYSNIAVLKKYYNVPRKLIPAMRGTILLFVSSTLLLALGYLLASW
jgi:1,4-dihydroxy-2-naphthoate octaprenyltransferase